MMSRLSLKSILMEAFDDKSLNQATQKYQNVEKQLPPEAQQYVGKLKSALAQSGRTSKLTPKDIIKIFSAPVADTSPPEADSPEDTSNDVGSFGGGLEPEDVLGSDGQKPEVDPQSGGASSSNIPQSHIGKAMNGLPSLAQLAKSAISEPNPPAGLPKIVQQPEDPFVGTSPDWTTPPTRPDMTNPAAAVPPDAMQHNTSVHLDPAAVANPVQPVTMDPRLAQQAPRTAPARISLNPADPTANPTGANDPQNLARIRQNLLNRGR